MVASVIRAVGTDELKAEIMPRFLQGEITIALGMTEPEVGSDVAGVSTRARRDGDRWIVDGQKMFTTNAHVADYVFLLTRTQRDGPKHAGLTMFLVPLDQPGIEVQAVYTLSGERTNIVFLNDVEVEDRWRIGEVDGGWQALMLALQDEHSAAVQPPPGPLAWRRSRSGRTRADRAGRARRAGRSRAVGDRAGGGAAARAAGHAGWRRTGRSRWRKGPMSKLFSTEADRPARPRT